MNTRPCSTCEHHKSKSNPTKGKLIPGHSGKCTRPEGLCTVDEVMDAQMAAAAIAETPLTASEIVGRPTVQNRIAHCADGDHELHCRLEGQAREAINKAQELGRHAGRELLTPALEDIACNAVSSLAPDISSTNVYHALHGWLGGPVNVPMNLKLSWDPKPGKVQMEPEATHFATPEAKACIPDLTPDGAHPITPDPVAELEASRNEMAAVDRAVMDAEEVYKDLGRIEAFEFTRHVADVAAAQIFQKIKKNKGYMNLPYLDSEGNTRHVASLEEFCEIKLGKSIRRVQELVQNLHMLGPALYESAERIGFRARDYRALKALPEADQEVVRQALEAEDKSQVLDILSDMAERHASEKAAKQKEADELQANLKARDKLLADKTKRLDETSMELSKLTSLPPAQNIELRLTREKQAVEALDKGLIEHMASTNKFYEGVAAVLAAEDVSAHTKDYALSAVFRCCEAMTDFLAQHGIDLQWQPIPDWSMDAAQANLEAGETEAPHGAHEGWE